MQSAWKDVSVLSAVVIRANPSASESASLVVVETPNGLVGTSDESVSSPKGDDAEPKSETSIGSRDGRVSMTTSEDSKSMPPQSGSCFPNGKNERISGNLGS